MLLALYRSISSLQNTLSDSQRPSFCECCLMPLAKDPLGEKRENPKYCSYCYSGGKLHADDAKNLAEFQEKVYTGMRTNGHSCIMAKFFSWTIRFAPYWKKRNMGK